MSQAGLSMNLPAMLYFHDSTRINIQVTKYRKDKAAESAHNVYHYKVDIASITHQSLFQVESYSKRNTSMVKKLIRSSTSVATVDLLKLNQF